MNDTQEIGRAETVELTSQEASQIVGGTIALVLGSAEYFGRGGTAERSADPAGLAGWVNA